MKDKTRIVLVDDHHLIIEGMKLLLEDETDIEITATFNSAKQLLAFAEGHYMEIDLIFLDMLMPEMPGWECAAIIRKNYPEIRIAVLSMESDPALIEKLINQTGVHAYLSKGVGRKELVEAIHQIMENHLYLSEDIENIISNYRRKLIDAEEMRLTAREKQIASLMCNGLTNEEIAERLFISDTTVATHRKNIYRKTDTHNVGQLSHKIFENRNIFTFINKN